LAEASSCLVWLKSVLSHVNDPNWIGAVAESAVIAKLTTHHYHVLNQVTGKAPFDLVAARSGKLWRISVKGTGKTIGKYGSYTVTICKTRHNTKRSITTCFAADECDVLAVYIHELNRVCFLKSSEVRVGRQLCLRMKNTPFSKNTYLIPDLEIPDF
jgi:hypothetical protein